MKIELMEPDEMRMLLHGARSFFAEGAIPGTLNEEHFVKQLGALITAGTGFVLGAFGVNSTLLGAIAGTAFPDFATGDLTAQEFFWYAPPEHRTVGLRLLAAFEGEAQRRGCVRIHMIHLFNEAGVKLSRFYERKGYRPLEIAFTKEMLPSNTR